ncbi:Cof-type HAD-IIB family hydrolase [Enterococcus mediterraneensis]|uniref:Cof-type HAD-IIB family hydrolase n=1 Tax=Enterococcus mediterraneensis TaxID=2364791 RepID=UPI000F05F53B|nr:Cof-type HAD-IIB family hydrolase [Enterococcus mediterraneensis]
MIKAIFFDIDGTLLSSNGKVLESTKEAIRQAREKGIYVGIATGRSPVHLDELLDNLELDVYVTYNGQLVYTKNAVIYAQTFDEKTLKKIVDFADDQSRQILFGGRNELEGSRTMMLSQSIIVKKMIRFLPRRFPVAVLKKTLQKLSFYKSDNHYERLAILQQPIYQCMMLSVERETPKLAAQFPACDFHRSNPYSVDIVPKGGSKLKGIYEFLDHHGIAVSETMAFGDHMNDIEMLKGIGIGIAMGNGQQAAKEAAAFVTDTNNKDGIAAALRHYRIID